MWVEEQSQESAALRTSSRLNRVFAHGGFRFDSFVSVPQGLALECIVLCSSRTVAAKL